jgi:hypothetical protein
MSTGPCRKTKGEPIVLGGASSAVDISEIARRKNRNLLDIDAETLLRGLDERIVGGVEICVAPVLVREEVSRGVRDLQRQQSRP